MREPNLPLAELTFTFEALDPVGLPTPAGPLWHGVFGRALRHHHCIMPKTPCPRCPLLHLCDYPYLFRRIAPPDSAMMAGKEVPVPHIFRPSTSAPASIGIGERLTVQMVVIGEANNRLDSIIAAMWRAGLDGLGRRRARARLLTVHQTGPLDVSSRLLWQGHFLAVSRPRHPESPPPPGTAILQFLTPYKPKERSEDLDLARLVMAIVRRVSLLQYFYTGRLLEADFQALKKMAYSWSPRAKETRWQPMRRYSASHRKVIDISGWIGAIMLDLTSREALWPYLWLGQWLGVGKNASMGLGHYRLDILPALKGEDSFLPSPLVTPYRDS